jgi:hypothetical protein
MAAAADRVVTISDLADMVRRALGVDGVDAQDEDDTLDGCRRRFNRPSRPGERQHTVRVYFVRHGQSCENVHGTYVDNPALTLRAITQAHVSGRRFFEYTRLDPAQVPLVSSHILRAIETAWLFGGMERSVTPSPFLSEVNSTDAVAMPAPLVPSSDPYEHLTADVAALAATLLVPAATTYLQGVAPAPLLTDMAAPLAVGTPSLALFLLWLVGTYLPSLPELPSDLVVVGHSNFMRRSFGLGAVGNLEAVTFPLTVGRAHGGDGGAPLDIVDVGSLERFGAARHFVPYGPMTLEGVAVDAADYRAKACPDLCPPTNKRKFKKTNCRGKTATTALTNAEKVALVAEALNATH